MGREFELKYAADAGILSALAAAYPTGRSIDMETTYYDTPDGAFAARQMTLRLRTENGVGLCTLKTPLADGSRGEWECHACSMDEGIQTLLKLGAPEQLVSLSRQGLIRVCGAKFRRLALSLPTADGQAELALDQGVLLGGGRTLPFWEVELELKSGSEQATVALAETLAAIYDLIPEQKSKFRRAMDLAKGE